MGFQNVAIPPENTYCTYETKHFPGSKTYLDRFILAIR